MRSKSIVFFMALLLAAFQVTSLLGVDYPIYSIGAHGGYAKNGLATGFNGRAFFRYSLEAYIPGFQIDVSYNQDFYQLLEDSVRMWPGAPADSTTEKIMYQTGLRNIFPAVSGSFHFKLNSGLYLYAGGGGQFHFLSMKNKQKERYWDDIGEKYQERDIAEKEYLNQVKFGFHWFAGARFALGSFGTFDVEVRQNYLTVSPDDWENAEAGKKWGDADWNTLTVSAGVTIYIF
ncbi:hypothetical protein B6D60_03595 [candidate division KSB1 bacterium 4484_87]|nr:MAG: hypothetical protein B6D60_03595 [candidate division KSB1 bacterium 4484_87]